MFKINETLRQNVISKIPTGYNSLQTCVFVYNYLCSILEYSIDYYANAEIYAPYFTDPKNIVKVDGISNNKVVCYTFCAIYRAIIESLNLPNVEFEEGGEVDQNGLFGDYHDYVVLKIEDAVYEADSSYAVFHSNDMVDQKFENRPLKYFTLTSVDKRSSRIAKRAELDNVIKQVAEDIKLEKLKEQYILQKGADYKTLPLENRYKLFKEMLAYTPDYSISYLNYVHLLKHSLFNETEYKTCYGKDKDSSLRQFFQTSFVRKALTGELITLIFYNPKGYHKTCPNFETLEIYEFSAKNKTLKPISRNALYENIVCKMLFEIDGYGNDPVELDSDVINMAVDIMPF